MGFASRLLAKIMGAFGLPVLFCMLQVPAIADVKLPAIISDHMVLQANTQPRIWGWAEPSEKIEVRYSGKVFKSHADASGKWQVLLGKIAPGTRFNLEIIGKNKITVKDVIAGEVWVCAGQSNMAFSLGSALNGKAELQSDAPPTVRFFCVKYKTAGKPSDDVEGSWKTFSARDSAPWSAVGYYFAKKISSQLQEPVGMIMAAVGGTSIQTWLSQDAIDAGALHGSVFREQLNKRIPTANACLFNSMINGYTPFTINGITWYQGEANVAQADLYGQVFPELIKDWRNQWHSPGLPFLFVQLPNFGGRTAPNGKSFWAELREAQSKSLRVKNTGMAVTIDVGDGKELHPPNKEPIGNRLALAALAIAYKQNVQYEGPVMDTIKAENHTLVLHFRHASRGLMPRSSEKALPNQTVSGFCIRGSDQKYFPAVAKINSDSITLSSNDVLEPIAVTYGWGDDTLADLQNGLKLPASPFRADLTTKNLSLPSQ